MTPDTSIHDLHYLDHAATSALRPPEVGQAILDYVTRIGATPGRGGHRLAIEAGRIVLATRTAVRDLMGRTGDPGRVAFGPNATWGLNTAIHGLVRSGDIIVNTVFDHNAVLRPSHAAAAAQGAELRLVPGNAEGELDAAAFAQAIDGARIVTVNAASNVMGSTLPVAALVEQIHAAGAIALVDSAQVLGHMPFDFGDADLIAFTGHKGLLGPQGIGGLWVRPEIELAGSHQGGTGGNSHERTMPAAFPDKLEPGTLNGPGIAGLLAGCRVVQTTGPGELHRRSSVLKARLIEGIDSIRGVRRVSPAAPDGAGLVTLVADAIDAASMGRALDRDHRVIARGGVHCAPEIHRLLGTDTSGGLRLSVGWGSSEADIDAALGGIQAVVRGGPGPRT